MCGAKQKTDSQFLVWQSEKPEIISQYQKAPKSTVEQLTALPSFFFFHSLPSHISFNIYLFRSFLAFVSFFLLCSWPIIRQALCLKSSVSFSAVPFSVWLPIDHIIEQLANHSNRKLIFNNNLYIRASRSRHWQVRRVTMSDISINLLSWNSFLLELRNSTKSVGNEYLITPPRHAEAQTFFAFGNFIWNGGKNARISFRASANGNETIAHCLMSYKRWDCSVINGDVIGGWQQPATDGNACNLFSGYCNVLAKVLSIIVVGRRLRMYDSRATVEV